MIAKLLGATPPADATVFRASDDGACWLSSGAVTFDNAGPVLAAAQELPLPATGVVHCDGITAVDSAAVALLLALKRSGAERGTPLTFVGMPAALTTLAELYGVEDIFSA